jgi:excinuclease UvrABC nuclease subunit
VEEEKRDLDKMDLSKMSKQDIAYAIEELRDQMDMASRNLDFEKAAELRDQIQTIRGKTRMKKHKFS